MSKTCPTALGVGSGRPPARRHQGGTDRTGEENGRKQYDPERSSGWGCGWDDVETVERGQEGELTRGGGGAEGVCTSTRVRTRNWVVGL